MNALRSDQILKLENTVLRVCAAAHRCCAVYTQSFQKINYQNLIVLTQLYCTVVLTIIGLGTKGV